MICKIVQSFKWCLIHTVKLWLHGLGFLLSGISVFGDASAAKLTEALPKHGTWIQENYSKRQEFWITAPYNFPACLSKEPRKGWYYTSKLERKQEENRLKKIISGFVFWSKKHKAPLTGDLAAFLTALLHSIFLAWCVRISCYATKL